MTDRKVPFWVKMSDPSRTFFDPTTQVYIAQDAKAEITVVTKAIREALGAGGLIFCEAPDGTLPSDEDNGIAPGSSTQETTSEGSDASEGGEELPDTTGDESEQEAAQTTEGETEGEENQQDKTQGEEEERELTLAEIAKLSKNSANKPKNKR
jgi:cobalamin biosynthesis protein CobT